MKELFNPPPIFAEITPASLRVLRENGGLELPLQRAADGKLTAACRKELISALQNFLGRKSWQLRARAVCGLSAHGVSLRKITVPTVADELENVLRLQIEKEFPLPPDELAWGWREIGGGPARREVIIIAVRKETVEDYAGIFWEAGANPEFTLSAFARESLCSSPNEPHALLEIERQYSELISFENGAASGLKILPANGSIADDVQKNSPDKIIFVSGNAAGQNEIWEKLSARFDCRRLEVPAGNGFSAATIGLKKSVSENAPLPRLQSNLPAATARFDFSKMDFSRPEIRRWLLRAAALLILLLILPFAEALLFKPLLAWKLNSFKNQRQQFVSVAEPELRFLQSLKQSQPPYLDAIYLLAGAASPGLRLDSLTINQQGNISLKAAMQNAQQVMDFRAKLIASGFFAEITVDEQTPAPNQQQVNVRMTAQWKSAAARAGLKIGPTPDEIKKLNAETNAAAPLVAEKASNP